MREISVPAPFTVGEHDNVAAMVFEHERDDPDYVIYQRLIDGVWTDVTCAEAANQIRAAALGLISLGVQAGDRVVIFSATRYEWAILDFAILAVGAVTVPIYETSSAEQVRWVLQDSEAVVLFAETDSHATMVAELSGSVPALREVLQIAGSGPNALDRLTEAGASVDPAELTARLAALRSTDPATLIYTSGTTGRPKGCQLTQSNLVHEIKGARAYHPTLLRKGERLLVFLPLAHVLARAISMAAFHSKVTVGFTSDIKNLLPMLAVFKPTVVVSVPRVFEKVYNTAEQNAANAGKGRIFAIAAQTAVDWSEACDRGGPGLLLRAKHAVFMGALMPVTGKLFDRFGAKWLAVIGLTITILTTLSFVNLTDSTSYAYLMLMSTGRRIGMALLLMPIQTLGLNQLPSRLNSHGTAISNTVRQVAGAVGTSLLVTVMTSRTATHFQEIMASGGAAGDTQQHMVMEASIQGINDSYLVIVGIGIIGLVLSFFIKQVGQVKEPAVKQQTVIAEEV